MAVVLMHCLKVLKRKRQDNDTMVQASNRMNQYIVDEIYKEMMKLKLRVAYSNPSAGASLSGAFCYA